MRLSFALGAIGMVLVSTAQLGAADLPAPDADVPVPPSQEERGIWAAIAYSEADEKHGFFWGADKRQEAMDIALEHCKNAEGKGCIVVEVFRNHRHWDDDDNTGFPYHHCGALAIGKEKGGRIMPWSAKSAPTRREAADLALAACEQSGTQCKVREWVCT
jgi:hypothetical protein